MKRYTKVIILIFSIVIFVHFSQVGAVTGASYLSSNCIKVQASELDSTASTEVSTNSANIATAGDAGFLYQERTLTDVYNVLVCILVVFVFWIIWNIVRVIVRILTDFKKY